MNCNGAKRTYALSAKTRLYCAIPDMDDGMRAGKGINSKNHDTDSGAGLP